MIWTIIVFVLQNSIGMGKIVLILHALVDKYGKEQNVYAPLT